VDDLQPQTLVIIPLLAVLAPLLARGMGRWVRVPVVVFELVLGILIGPAVLGWVGDSAFIELMADFGLATLFFVAGTEIEFGAFRGRLGRRASLGWLLSLGAGVLSVVVLTPWEAAVVIGIALSSTALGTLLPVLRDAGELKTPFGQAVGAVGALGEFGPLIAISLFLGSRDIGLSTLVLLLFILISGLAIWLAFRIPHGAMHKAVSATLHTSGQFAIRVILLILGGLVAVSVLLELDFLLGAFTAGIVWRLIMRDADEADREAVESKVEAVAFGFLVPIFFIYTGVTFDLQALLADPILFLGLPIVLVALFVIRGLPSMLASPVGANGRERLAMAFMGATGLPIIVAVTSIGLDEDILTTVQAALLVGGGMLSVLLFPLIAMRLRGERAARVAPTLDDMA